MRAAPLALFYYRDPDALFQKTVDSCRVTHTHPSAIAGALVSAFSIRYCLTHQELDQQAYLSTLADVAGEYDPDMKQRLVELPDLLHEPVEQVWEALFRHSSALRTPVWDVIPVAIYAFLKHPEDYARCVLFCVNAGWDTDTMAAIAGNTSGAWHGLTGIPQRWVRDLENGYKGRDDIIALGRALYGRNGLPTRRGFLSDYLADWGRNVRFLFELFMRKPFV
jgi:ADP-ribosylglycohydrolase